MALLVTDSFPVTAPLVVGAKATRIWQLVAAAKAAGQLLV